MRNSEKVKQDQEKGLFIKKMRAGAKGMTTTIVNSAILRAMRRKRIEQDTAQRCMQNWSKDMAKRSQAQIWSAYASAQLLEVAKRRKQGNLASARIVLCDAKSAIYKSRVSACVASS